MALKQLCPDVNFRNPYVDSENMFQMHTIWQPFPPPVRPELDEANGIIGEEAANPRFSYQMFKLMRASHEGELITLAYQMTPGTARSLCLMVVITHIQHFSCS